MAYKLFLLKRIRPFLPIQSSILFFNYYIKPYFEYFCIIWGSTFRENINIVVELQKRAARLILDADFSIRSKLLFSELKWVPFTEIVKFYQLSLVFKCMDNFAPIYLHNMFRSTSNDYLLRSSGTGQLDVLRQHTRSLSLIGPKLWNNLNKEIRNCNIILNEHYVNIYNIYVCLQQYKLCFYLVYKILAFNCKSALF